MRKRTRKEAGRRNATVSDETVEDVISSLRKILGEGSIETVPGKGYRFACPVERIYRDADGDDEVLPH